MTIAQELKLIKKPGRFVYISKQVSDNLTTCVSAENHSMSQWQIERRIDRNSYLVEVDRLTGRQTKHYYMGGLI